MSRLVSLIGILAVLGLSGAVAHAEAWKERAEIRLLDGGMLADGKTRLAGLEVALDPSWKTYWRNPGDSGIPPRMDFSGSRNVAGVTIEWPAPELHFDGYGWVIGYTDAVIFPLLVETEDPAAPTRLELKLDYAVCKDICIPAEAEAEIALGDGAPRTSSIDFYRARVPEHLETASDKGGVVLAAVTDVDGVPVLDVHVQFPRGGDDAFAVVEGPEGWYLPVPERLGTDDDGNAVFRVPLDGVEDPDAIPGARLRVTGVSPVFSFEQPITLD